MPGRNDPCPCGSGKKYKKCCGQATVLPIDQRSLNEQIDLAYMYIDQRRFHAANEIVASLLKSYSSDAEVRYLSAQLSYFKGDLKKAATGIIDLLQVSPNNAVLLENLARIFFELSEYKQSEEYARRSLSVSNSVEAYNHLGNALSAQGQFNEAIDTFKTALKIDPDNSGIWNNIGTCYQGQNDLDHAMLAYNKVLTINDTDLDANNNIASIYIQKQDYQKALYHLSKIETFADSDFEIAINLGNVYRNLGIFDVSRQWYDKASGINPDHIGIFINLGLLFADLGHFDSAIDYLKQALLKDSENTRILKSLADIEERRHNLDDAEDYIQEAINSGSSDLIACKLVLARILRRRKQFDKALDLLDSIAGSVQSDADIAAYNFELAQHKEAEKDFDAAYNAYEKANIFRERTRGVKYDHQKYEKYFLDLKNIFRKENWSQFRSALPKNNDFSPKPIFIVGFPRSGTTVVEQIISSHSLVSAGDELEIIGELINHTQDILGSKQPYPECITDSAHLTPDGIEAIRDEYLRKAGEVVGWDDSVEWFTDKLPLNAINLGFIKLLFPNSPIIHVRRIPMDACLSAFFTDFTASNEYSFHIEDTARFYREVIGLVNHYIREIPMHYLEVRYEDIVAGPEEQVRTILRHIGLGWEDACLNFHQSKRIVKTASYEQVTRPIYSSSVERYRNYEAHLARPLEILGPLMADYREGVR